MSKTVHLQMPLTEQQVRDLELGDEVFLSGDAFCMLYGSHYTLILDALKAGKKPPMELEGRAIYNTGVIWRREETENRLYALGTTASYKFNAFGPEFIRRTGIRLPAAHRHRKPDRHSVPDPLYQAELGGRKADP